MLADGAQARHGSPARAEDSASSGAWTRSRIGWRRLPPYDSLAIAAGGVPAHWRTVDKPGRRCNEPLWPADLLDGVPSHRLGSALVSRGELDGSLPQRLTYFNEPDAPESDGKAVWPGTVNAENWSDDGSFFFGDVETSLTTADGEIRKIQMTCSQ